MSNLLNAMYNPARTAEHINRIDKRRSDLQSQVAGLFLPSTQLVCEFGCGHGHFLAAYASAHPESQCVGLDISRERIERADRKRDRAKLANLRFVHADAGDFLGALPAGTTFSEIYILFPDPWPKRRHHKNRLMQPDFLENITRRAGEGARLYFRTDYEPYFREVELLLGAHPSWQLLAGPWPFEQVTVFQSRAPHHFSLAASRRV